MPDQIDPFDAAGRIRVSRMTSAPSRDFADNAWFALRTMATAIIQIRARLFQTAALRVRAREFFGERNIALGHFHKYRRQAHLCHT
jgi:hypothetical protein